VGRKSPLRPERVKHFNFLQFTIGKISVNNAIGKNVSYEVLYNYAFRVKMLIIDRVTKGRVQRQL